jgi:hypothetical protein
MYNKYVWHRDYCGLEVSGKDQCEHVVITEIHGHDSSLTGVLHLCSIFISVGSIKQISVKCLGLSKIEGSVSFKNV